MKTSAARYRFSTMLLTAFLALSVPTLIVVLSCAYIESSKAARQVLQYDAMRGQKAITRSLDTFFAESISAVQGLARLAEREPDFFRTSAGAITLQGQFVGMTHLDAIRITYEDGYSVGSVRVNDSWRKDHSEAPPSAVLHNFTIETSSSGARPVIHQSVIDQSGNLIPLANALSPTDPRESEHYASAKRSKQTVITEPNRESNREHTTISVTAPILIDGIFRGIVFATVTTEEIARFLHLNRPTSESFLAIIDRSGHIIVPPMSSSTDAVFERDKNDMAALGLLKSHVAKAMQLLQENSTPERLTVVTIAGVGHLVSISPIETEFNLSWRLLTSTPKSDFIGPLQRAHSFIAWLVVAIIPLQLLLLHRLSRRVARGIEAMALDVQNIRSMDFKFTPTNHRPITREIAELYDGIKLLNRALRSFAQYIPLGVVRQLIAKGQPLELGVEQRKLAIMFTDLENFSTFSQSSSPEQLLAQLSAIFSVMTSAVTEELGTVDKFIGDSVMAFWGAPGEIEDSALRACKAALRITHRLDQLNQQWREEGKTCLRVRVGIHYANVLVGNIGTAERLSYTALGDGVNVAARLEGSNKQFSTSICVSDVLFNEVASSVEVHPLGLVSVKGRTGEFPAYELLGIRGSTDPELSARGSTECARTREMCSV